MPTVVVMQEDDLPLIPWEITEMNVYPVHGLFVLWWSHGGGNTYRALFWSEADARETANMAVTEMISAADRMEAQLP